MPERAPRRTRAETQTISSKGGEPPRRRTAVATAEPPENRIEKVFRIIETMDASELQDLSAAVREKLI